MKVYELLEKVQTDIEALTAEPLCDFEVYILPLTRQPVDERVVLGFAATPEQPMGISAGVGYFEDWLDVTIRAEFPLDASDEKTSREKAFALYEQLKAYVRDNRGISAGDDTSRYATYRDGEPAIDIEDLGGGEADSQEYWIVTVIMQVRTEGG